MKLILATKVRKEIEVTFPIYRYHLVGDDHETEYFAKIIDGSNGPMKYEIRRGCRFCEVDEWELSVRKFRPHPDEDPNYVLGRHEYALTVERWEEIRVEFEQWAKLHLFIS